MNSLIKWDDKYDTGNFVIDYQHKRLVRLINDLDEVRQHEELKPSLLNAILDEVSNYTHYHFQSEEDIMEKINYSSRDEHKRLHRDFILKLAHFKTEYEKGATNIDDGFCLFLKGWLINHILIEDPKMILEMSRGQGVV